jgi:ABC-type transport system involved in multi-copper enzyme maturation permease subunit
LGVARYERIMLMRTTRFRVLGLIGIGIPLFFGVVLSIAETQGEIGEGSAFGISSFIPFYFYTYVQTVVIAFVAGSFRAADERAEVSEVIAARPLSTAELVLGKYLGVVEALTALSLCVGGLTIAIQLTKLSITGQPFLVMPYVGYFLLMTLPALIFMSALTFSLGALLRNPTAVALVSIAYIIAVLFFLGTRYGGIFDFGAFFAPLFFSDMIGLGDITRLLQIRVFYLALGAGLLGLSIAAYPRLPQPGLLSKIGHAIAIAGLAGAVAMFGWMARQDTARDEWRAELFATQISHADAPVATVLDYGLDIAVMKDGVPLAVDAELRLRNDNPAALSELIFTLNPGLELAAVRDGAGTELAWQVEGSVLTVTPALALAPGAENTVTMSYAGTVDTEGFDLMRGAARLEKWDGPIHKGDLTAWIRGDTAFLPPRARWYPVPGVDYGNSGTRPVSFSTARLELDVPGGLEVITQGRPVASSEEGGRSLSSWQVGQPVPQLSLNVGAYEIFATRAADIDVALYIHPLHVETIMFLEEAREEIVALIEQLMTAMAQETGLPYPYPRLSVVEVPFLVQWYFEGWEESGGLTQPGVLMIEEDQLIQRTHRMETSIRRRLRSSDGDGADPVRLKRDEVASNIFQTFLSPEDDGTGLFRSPLVQLWSFNRAFEGDNATLLARGMPVFMQEDLSGEIRSAMFQGGRGGRGGRGGFDRGRPQDRSFDDGPSFGPGGGRQRQLGENASWDEMLEAMQTQSLADLDPTANPDLYRSVLDAKGLTMFRMIEAVVGSDQFVNTLEAFGESSQYQDISFADFERAVVPEGTSAEEVDRSNLERLIRGWIHGTYVPGYTLTRTEAKKVEDERGAVVYQVMVRIRNGEPGRGFVQVQLMGRGDEITKNVEIEGGQEVEVSMVIGVRPGIVTVEPFLAKNRRALRSPLRIPEEVEPGPPQEYVHVVTEEEAAYTEIIVDNEDEGFSMPVRRTQRYLRPGLEGGQWGVWDNPYAFGRYETNFRTKSAGDGAQPAVWTATLPHAGEYDVAYYFLPRRINGNTRNGFWGASTYRITVMHAGQSTDMLIDTEQFQPGWNALGRFRFEAGEEAVIELSDLADGRLYADAVRWRYVDPDNPNAVYDEGIMPWEFGGGRGGERGAFGGRGGGGRGNR